MARLTRLVPIPGLMLVAAAIASPDRVPPGWLARKLTGTAVRLIPLLLAGINVVRLALVAAAVLYIATALFWPSLPKESLAAEPDLRKRASSHLPALLVLIAIAAILRLGNITASFWWDELGTMVRVVQRGIPAIFGLSAAGNNHVLNSLLAFVSWRIFGHSEWAARVPAFLCGVLTPPAAYWLGLRVFRRPAAFGLGLLLAVHFRCVVHSAEARGYAGSLLFSLIACFLFLRLCNEFRRSTAIAYVLSVAAAIGFQFLSIFVPIAHAAALGVWTLYDLKSGGRSRLPVRFAALLATAWGALAGFTIYALQLPELLEYSHAATNVHVYMGWPLLSSTLVYLAGGSTVWVACLASLCALLGWSRRYRDIPLLISVLFPGCFMMLAFTVFHMPASPRLFIVSILPMAIGIVLFLEGAWTNGIAGKALGGALVLLLVADSLPAFQGYYGIGNAPLRPVASRVGDRLIWLVGDQASLNRYYFRHALDFRSEEEAAQSGAGTPDFIMVQVNCRSIQQPVQLQGAGFHRIEELRDWTISEPAMDRRSCYVLLGR